MTLVGLMLALASPAVLAVGDSLPDMWTSGDLPCWPRSVL
jgi:hypothetical protein